MGTESRFSPLNSLVDEAGENAAHPLASLMEIVGVLIDNYEDQNVRSWRLRD